ARRAVSLGIRCVQRVLGDRVYRRISLEDMERRRDPDAEPAAARAGNPAIRAAADDDHRPARGSALVSALAVSVGFAPASGVPAVPPPHARALLAGAADARP